MRINRPIITNSWAEDGQRIEPSETKIAEGWIEEIPPHQYQNYWQYNTDQSLRYFLQSPIPEWNESTDYYPNISYALGSDGVIYQAILESGVNNPINPSNGANPTYWRNALVYAVNTNNSASATKLQTARKINGHEFDGTVDINIRASDVGALPQDGNAASATKLQTARRIGNVLFDGTRDIRPDARYVDYSATVSAPSEGYNTNIRELRGLNVALTIAQGGTGAKTVANAKTNLELNLFQQQTNEPRVFQQNGRGYLSVQTNGTVGYYNLDDAQYKWTFDANGRMQTGIIPIARVEGLEAIISDLIPVGVPIPYPKTVPPTGWIVCAGQAFSAVDYPALADAYPTLRLPDLRGNFIRGWDGQRGYDPNRSILSQQQDTMQAMTGNILYSQAGGLTIVNGVYKLGTGISYFLASGVALASSGEFIFDNSLVARTSEENRPKNIAFNYIVRAR